MARKNLARALVVVSVLAVIALAILQPAAATFTNRATDVVCNGCVGSPDIHDHSIGVWDLYFDPATQAELNALGSGGTVNAAGNPVAWSKLKGVPSIIADGKPRPGSTITAIDAGLDSLGRFNSITTGVDGLGIASYRDRTTGGVKVAHCSDVACTSAALTTIYTTGVEDPLGTLSAYTSIAIAPDGRPVVAFQDLSAQDLAFARCGDVVCSSAGVTHVDTGGDVGGFASIAIGSDGLPFIAYQDGTNLDLKAAHCSDLGCTTATTTTLDQTGDVGMYTSVAVGADALPVISYRDHTNFDLKVAHCNDVVCTGAGVTSVDSGPAEVGEFTSIAIGSDGLAIVSYHDDSTDDLKVAHCDDLACTGATASVIDATGYVGTRTSVAIGVDGRAVISYHDYTNEKIKVAHCSDVTCSTASSVAVAGLACCDTEESSLTIGSDGKPLVSFWDPFNHDLMVTHCSNVFCVPNARAR